MTRYFEKTTGGSAEHFKITVGEHWISVTEGQINQTLSNWSQGFSTYEQALQKAEDLIATKVGEGYQEKQYIETLENSFSTYDKAKWHYEADDFPKELDYTQGFVHTGMFLWWLIESGLMSEEFNEDFEEEIQQCQGQQLTGSEVLRRMDGVLTIEDVGEEGNAFGVYYYHNQYMEDYSNTLCEDLPSAYHVEDSKENYLKVKAVIDQRYQDWKQSKE